ncbi:hypothetical protein, partial [Amycolatopsis vancoresmycina]
MTAAEAQQDLLLVFDETVTRADVDGWLRHLSFAGAPTRVYRLGAGHVLPVSGVDSAELLAAAHHLPAPTRQVVRGGAAWLGGRPLRPAGT